jgi:hypothetical protein
MIKSVLNNYYFGFSRFRTKIWCTYLVIEVKCDYSGFLGLNFNWDTPIITPTIVLPTDYHCINQLHLNTLEYNVNIKIQK